MLLLECLWISKGSFELIIVVNSPFSDRNSFPLLHSRYVASLLKKEFAKREKEEEEEIG